MLHDPFHYLFDYTIRFALESYRILIVLIISIIYDILAIIVLFRVWKVRIDFLLRFAILCLTVWFAPVGYPLFWWARRKYGVYDAKPKKPRKGKKGKKVMQENNINVIESLDKTKEEERDQEGAQVIDINGRQRVGERPDGEAKEETV